MRYILTIIILLIISSTAFGGEYRGACTITFKADSTLHEVHGKGKCQPFTASSQDGILEVSPVAVAVSTLDTDNAKRDRKMREMFNEKGYPFITGTSMPVALEEIRRAKEGGTAKFQLKIRDIVRPVTATVTNFSESTSRITADLTFTLSLAEYALQPPSVIGLIRVDDKVAVTVGVMLEAR